MKDSNGFQPRTTRIAAVLLLAGMLFILASGCARDDAFEKGIRQTEIALAAQQTSLVQKKDNMVMEATVKALESTVSAQNAQATTVAAIPPTPTLEPALPTPLPVPTTEAPPPSQPTPTAPAPPADAAQACGIKSLTGKWMGKVPYLEVTHVGIYTWQAPGYKRVDKSVAGEIEQTDCSISGNLAANDGTVITLKGSIQDGKLALQSISYLEAVNKTEICSVALKLDDPDLLKGVTSNCDNRTFNIQRVSGTPSP
jgi:hypothetical protein